MEPADAVNILDQAAAQARLTRDETSLVLTATSTLRSHNAEAQDMRARIAELEGELAALRATTPPATAPPGEPAAPPPDGSTEPDLAAVIAEAPKPPQNRKQRRAPAKSGTPARPGKGTVPA